MSHGSAYPRVFLVGFMGSGKTSVGRGLASQIGVEFFDTDAWIEAREARSVTRIFAEDGEPYFRERESEALETACLLPSVVVATGGGLFLSTAHRARIRERGVSVWLDTPLDRIWEHGRASHDRPLWGSKEDLAERLRERVSAYREADWRIEVGERGVEEIVEQVRRLVAPGNKEV